MVLQPTLFHLTTDIIGTLAAAFGSDCDRDASEDGKGLVQQDIQGLGTDIEYGALGELIHSRGLEGQDGVDWNVLMNCHGCLVCLVIPDGRTFIIDEMQDRW